MNSRGASIRSNDLSNMQLIIYSRVSVITSSQVEFGVIPHDHWYQPDWIDENKAKASREKMEKDNIIYGGSVSYRNMCRFNSGVSSVYLEAAHTY